MKPRNVLFMLALCFLFPMLVFSQVRPKSNLKKPAGAPARAPMRKSVLPDQPRCDTPALPDIIIDEFRFSGPGGPWRPTQQYGIAVVLRNRGQCQSGAFFVKLEVRVQSQGKDEMITVGSKKVNSISPEKTGSSPGTAVAVFDYNTADYPWAQYTFTATADSTGHIEEFDEGNNSKTSIDQVVDINRLN